MADVAEGVPGFHRLDPLHQRVMRDLDQAFGFAAEFARDIHPAVVAVPAVQDDGHVDVQDVAVLQRARAGNAVADDVVDADAGCVLIPAIADGGRHRACRLDAGLNEVIQRARRDAGCDKGRHLVQDCRGKPTGAAHPVKIRVFVNSDAVPGQTAARVVHRLLHRNSRTI